MKNVGMHYFSNCEVASIRTFTSTFWFSACSWLCQANIKRGLGCWVAIVIQYSLRCSTTTVSAFWSHRLPFESRYYRTSRDRNAGPFNPPPWLSPLSIRMLTRRLRTAACSPTQCFTASLTFFAFGLVSTTACKSTSNYAPPYSDNITSQIYCNEARMGGCILLHEACFASP